MLWELKSKVGNVSLPIFDELSSEEEPVEKSQPKKVDKKQLDPMEFKPCDEEIEH